MAGRMHYWTGSRTACGLRDAEFTTEAADNVRCLRCMPAARRFMQAIWAEDDAERARQTPPTEGDV